MAGKSKPKKEQKDEEEKRLQEELDARLAEQKRQEAVEATKNSQNEGPLTGGSI